MPVLLRNIAEIKAHWHAVAAAMETILPPSGGKYRAEFENSVVTLVCSKFPGEAAERIGGTIAPVVPLVQTTPDDAPLHWLGWFEEWSDPPTAKRRQLQFGASAITVYFGEAESPKRQLLRAEWSGVQRSSAGGDIFQAPGSAHPHWHVDGIRNYFTEIEHSLSQQLSTGEVGVREFTGDDLGTDAAEFSSSPQIRIPDSAELCWTGIHFPGQARWSEKPWLGPVGPHDTHAVGPTDLIQVQGWLTSCARYLQAQIQDQLLRNRR